MDNDKSSIPVEKYATENALSSDDVIQLIQEGELAGFIKEEKWYVDLQLTDKLTNREQYQGEKQYTSKGVVQQLHFVGIIVLVVGHIVGFGIPAMKNFLRVGSDIVPRVITHTAPSISHTASSIASHTASSIDNIKYSRQYAKNIDKSIVDTKTYDELKKAIEDYNVIIESDDLYDRMLAREGRNDILLKIEAFESKLPNRKDLFGDTISTNDNEKRAEVEEREREREIERIRRQLWRGNYK